VVSISFHWNDYWEGFLIGQYQYFGRTEIAKQNTNELNCCSGRYLAFEYIKWSMVSCQHWNARTFYRQNKHDNIYNRKNHCHLQPTFSLMVILWDIPLNELWFTTVRYTRMELGGGFCNLLSETGCFHGLDLFMNCVFANICRQISKWNSVN
jgi:hypothetical protein